MRVTLARLVKDAERLQGHVDELAREMDTGNAREQVKGASTSLEWTLQHLHRAESIKNEKARHLK